ncbi:hypothetical protein FHS33_004806 [Streptomyces calvus]|uniref:Uncharacterized protein n=1 Tax=Streptomyces calvus TaxID=67282 RepID=A0AA40VIY2_9ACTN|nr:hypothetical protein [Streptomyces calvus]
MTDCSRSVRLSVRVCLRRGRRTAPRTETAPTDSASSPVQGWIVRRTDQPPARATAGSPLRAADHAPGHWIRPRRPGPGEPVHQDHRGGRGPGARAAQCSCTRRGMVGQDRSATAAPCDASAGGCPSGGLTGRRPVRAGGRRPGADPRPRPHRHCGVGGGAAFQAERSCEAWGRLNRCGPAGRGQPCGGRHGLLAALAWGSRDRSRSRLPHDRAVARRCTRPSGQASTFSLTSAQPSRSASRAVKASRMAPALTVPSAGSGAGGHRQRRRTRTGAG